MSEPDNAKRVFDYSAITRYIETEATKRMVSPWTLLGGALTRAALATPCDWLLPAIVQGDAGLNQLLLNVGPSGSGKGAGKVDVLSWPDVGVFDLKEGEQRLQDVFVPVTVASGEAFGSLFVETQQLPADGGKGKISVPVRIRYAAWADFDEVDQVAAIGGRQGSTLTLEIRKAWSGNGIGTFTKVKANRATVGAHTYRLVVTVGAQPLRCGPILAEETGGTLQRALWLDATIPPSDDEDDDEDLDMTPSVPMSITLPRFTAGKHYFDVDPEIWREVRRDHKRQRWTGEDGHRNLVKLKAAASFAVLHGSTEITPAIWEVADALMSHSDAVRASVRAELRREEGARQESAAIARTNGELISASARVDAIDRAAAAVVRKMRRNPAPMTARDMSKALNNHRRSLFPEALDLLIDLNSVVEVKGETTRSSTRFYRLVNP